MQKKGDKLQKQDTNVNIFYLVPSKTAQWTDKTLKQYTKIVFITCHSIIIAWVYCFYFLNG